ncbi:MAG: SDR family NAD(P)-dependent oxidoreductase [Flavobacteriaceae bacterium]|nr:SDR family NAD(P)-dependent oxidoreductase [Flavobacteriaceae bacterium]
MRLNKNKILITGATAGIGEALSKKFIELGNEVIAIGRDEKKLQKLAKYDKRIIPFSCDVSSQQELDKLTLFIEQEHKDLNILINNAGIQYNYNFSEEHQLLNKVEHEVNVNLLAPLKLISLLLPILEDNDNSAIVNISSGLAIVPKAEAPVYCATKAGIHIFSKSLRYQLEKVKVFEIIPPLVETTMTQGRGKDKISPQELVEEFIKAFENNKYEVSIGKVKLLKIINRISPTIADNIMKGTSKKQ